MGAIAQLALFTAGLLQSLPPSQASKSNAISHILPPMRTAASSHNVDAVYNIHRHRSLLSEQCDNDSEALRAGNSELSAAANMFELGEEVTINEEESIFTISHPDDLADEFQEACTNADGFLTGTREAAMQCLNANGIPTIVVVWNMYKCLAKSCVNQLTEEDLLLEVNAKNLFTCSLQGSENIDAPVPVLPPVETKWKQCDVDVIPFMLNEPSLRVAARNAQGSMKIQKEKQAAFITTSGDVIDPFRAACQAANGTLEGIENRVYHCLYQERQWTYTILNQYECYPKGCEGYPLDRKLTPFWGECSTDTFPEENDDSSSTDRFGMIMITSGLFVLCIVGGVLLRSRQQQYNNGGAHSSRSCEMSNLPWAGAGYHDEGLANCDHNYSKRAFSLDCPIKIHSRRHSEFSSGWLGESNRF